jgi:myosin heavy subunit
MHFRKIIASIHFDSNSNRIDIFAEECLIENDPSKYFYIAQGMLTIDNVDDAEEMRLTSEAFDVLGFTQVDINKMIIIRRMYL